VVTCSTRLFGLLSLTLLLPACGDDSTATEGESSTSATAGTTGSGSGSDTGQSGSESSADGESDTATDPALSLVDPVAGSEYPFASEVDVEWTFAGLPADELFTVELAHVDAPDLALLSVADLPPADADSGVTTLALDDQMLSGGYIVRVRAQDTQLEDEAPISIWGLEPPTHPVLVNRHYIRPGRDLIALPRKAAGGEQAVFLSWRARLDDGDQVDYELRRGPDPQPSCDGPGLTTVTTTTATSFLDETVEAGLDYHYCLRPRFAGEGVGPGTATVSVTASGGASPYDAKQGAIVTLPIGQSCTGNLEALANGIIPGDLDGDGDTDFVVRFCDQAQGICDGSNYFVEAFERGPAGWSSSWCHDTASTSTPVVVWDLDLDGAAEVVSIDQGSTLLRVLDGASGAEVASHSNAAADWGNYGHRWYSRLNVAYLDGLTPLLIGQNTHFATDQPILITGWRLEGDTLVEVEEFEWLYSVGTHGLPVADIDGDGRDEVVPCGKALELVGGEFVERWTIPNSPPSFAKHHDDTCHSADLVPSLPGLETMFGIERNSGPLAAGVGVVDKDGAVLWSRANSSFQDGNVEANFHGWDKGHCFQTDTGAMECIVFELCEDQGCMGNQGLDKNDYWTRTFIFDTETGAVVQDFGPKKNTTVGRTGLDWDEGAGVVTLIGGGLGAGYYTKDLDLVGDARMEIAVLAGDQLDIHVNAAPQQVRHLAPSYDPNYSKPITQHANGGYTYTSEATITSTFVLGCELGPERRLALAPGERASFVCAVGSLQGFAGPVTISAKGVPAGVSAGFGPERLETLVVELGPDQAVPFRVFFEASADAAASSTTIRLRGDRLEPEFSLIRRLRVRVEVE
jgi:hypothetical protein